MVTGTCSRVGLALALVAALGLVGCHASIVARLAYPPPGDLASSPVLPADAPAVVLQPVVDQRKERTDLVGRFASNVTTELLGMREVTTPDDVPGWVRGALRRELELAGVRVVDGGPQTGGPVLTPFLVNAWCYGNNADRRYEAKFEFRIAIGTASGTLLDQAYKSRWMKDTQLFHGLSEEGYAPCLAYGLQDVARKIAADAATALRAGAPPPTPR